MSEKTIIIDGVPKVPALKLPHGEIPPSSIDTIVALHHDPMAGALLADQFPNHASVVTQDVETFLKIFRSEFYFGGGRLDIQKVAMAADNKELAIAVHKMYQLLSRRFPLPRGVSLRGMHPTFILLTEDPVQEVAAFNEHPGTNESRWLGYTVDSVMAGAPVVSDVTLVRRFDQALQHAASPVMRLHMDDRDANEEFAGLTALSPPPQYPEEDSVLTRVQYLRDLRAFEASPEGQMFIEYFELLRRKERIQEYVVHLERMASRVPLFLERIAKARRGSGRISDFYAHMAYAKLALGEEAPSYEGFNSRDLERIMFEQAIFGAQEAGLFQPVPRHPLLTPPSDPGTHFQIPFPKEEPQDTPPAYHAPKASTFYAQVPLNKGAKLIPDEETLKVNKAYFADVLDA